MLRAAIHSLAILLVLVIARGDPAFAETEDLAPLKVEVDKSKVDLDGHRLELKMSRAVSHVEIKVYGEDGELIASERHDFEGKGAGEALVVTWSPLMNEPPAKIEVYGHDVHGYYAGVRIVPWSLWVPHEEVLFENDSATIRASEERKLSASFSTVQEALQKHSDLGGITLYVAGHTDTIGSAAHNLELSRRRARSIALWFRDKELELPVKYEGFGEHALLVHTKDEVREPKNRRVDYVLSVEDPSFKNSKRRPAWKSL